MAKLKKSAIAIFIIFALLIVSLYGCSRNDLSVQSSISDSLENTNNNSDDIVLTVGKRNIFWSEFLFYVKYYATYMNEYTNDIDNWFAEYSNGMTYQEYILNGTVEWLKYDEAIKLKADEINCELDDEDKNRINKQWEILFESYENKEVLLNEMSTYYCNEKLYKEMISGFLLSDKCFELLYGNEDNDTKSRMLFEQEISELAENDIEVSYTDLYENIALNDIEYF